MRAVQRWPLVGAFAALLVGSLLLDRVPSSLPPQLQQVDAAATRAAIESPASLTTSWYCAIGSSERGGYGSHTINVSNVADEAATATVSVITDHGPGPKIRLEVGPYATESLDLSTVDSSVNAAAVIEVVGGNGVVGHDIETLYGTTSGPCATTVNGTWYFASGSTRRDSDQYVALLNPFGEDVVLDVTFRTATRERRPEDLSSLVVPGRTVRVFNVADYVSIEPVVATTVTALQGRVVAEQLQVANGELGPEGAAVVLGTPAPSLTWALPAGRVSTGSDHQLVIHNPGLEQAELELFFDLSSTDRRAAYGLNPIDLSVQPGRFESLDVADLIGALEIPLPLEFGLRIQSANDVPVVVSRSQLHPLVDNTLVGAEDSGATVEVAGDAAAASGGEDADDAVVTIDPSTIERRDPLGGNLVRQSTEDLDDVSVDDLVPDLAAAVLDDLAQPTAISGVAVSNGSSAPSHSWVVPFTRFEPDGGTVVAITATEGDALVELRGMVDGRLLEPERVAIAEQTRRVVPVVLPVLRTALLVTSDSPISVEVQTVTDGALTVAGAVPVLTP
ncbi:MAG: hypothetical protein HKN24_07025 [Acidimicrobiales bacterium]|nr:hypothetical protein [Acidimicrobiales bacterium]